MAIHSIRICGKTPNIALFSIGIGFTLSPSVHSTRSMKRRGKVHTRAGTCGRFKTSTHLSFLRLCFQARATTEALSPISGVLGSKPMSAELLRLQVLCSLGQALLQLYSTRQISSGLRCPPHTRSGQRPFSGSCDGNTKSQAS